MKKVLRTVLDLTKANLVLIFLLSIILALQTIELDYSIYSPGGLINIGDRLDNKEYEAKGSFNMTYVNYRKGSLFNLIIAQMLPSQDIIKNEEITVKNEEIEDSLLRSDLLMKECISNSLYIAYTKAGRFINPIKEHDYVYYKVEESISTLKIGDEIIACDNNPTSNYDELIKCLDNHSIGEEVNLRVIRGKKEVDTKSTIGNNNKVGIIIYRTFDYERDPYITYKVEKNESGSSGGLMLTLSIYNALIEEDITKGMKIAGTGTMETDGSVGEIAGVKYKVKAAAKNKVDLFVVPEANYEEAEQVIKDNKLNVRLLKADTFDQVLEDLKNYN